MTRKRSTRRRASPDPTEQDLLALAAIARLEPREPAQDVVVSRALVAGGRSTPFPTRDSWLDYLFTCGTLLEPSLRFDDGKLRGVVTVPCWANDLFVAVVSQAGLVRRREASRAVRQAVRDAGRSPLFRARLAAEAARIRGEAAGSSDTTGDQLLRWLREYDWSGASAAPPATSTGAPKAESGRT